MSFYDAYYRPDDMFSKFVPKVEIYLNSENEIECVHRRCGKYRVHDRLPKITREEYMYGSKRHYYLRCETFLHMNDENGECVHINTIKLNKELTSVALTNPAMNTIYKQDNLFEIEPMNTNKQLLIDVFEWVCNTLHIRKKVINAKVIAAVLAIALLAFPLSQCFAPGDRDYSRNSSDCKSCHRTFYSGDSAGNYKNIARTGMCNNCYSNYKWATGE